MARWESYVKLFIPALFILNYAFVNAQIDCTTTQRINRTVSEGDPEGMLVIDFQREFDHTGSNLLFFTSVTGESQLLSVVFQNHFNRTRSEIRTRNVIDRDTIARELGNTFAPVVFPVTLVVVQTLPSLIQTCYEMKLIVADKNDNSPRFNGYENGERYLAMLNEGDPNTDYPIIRARDDDEGVNSTRSYELHDNLGKFMLEIEMANNGQIVQLLLKLQENVTLNYEEETNYNLTIIAKEGNDNPRNATLQVNVAVIDACDESPFFPMSAYFPRVRENSPLNTVINATITAMDQDLIDRDRLEYRINDVCAQVRVDSNCVHITDYPFMLDRETGVLTLIGELDREDYEEYVVSVHAVDGCGRSATASVMIIVDDENDNAPEVNYNAGVRNISENSPQNTRIGFITVSDEDAGVNAEFVVELFENSTGTLVPSQTFQLIEGSARELRIQSVLDRETTDRYSLVVRVTDNGTPSLTTLFPLEITVTDFNDNPPVIDRESIDPEYRVVENLPMNTVIVTLFANDSDIGGNGLVSFHLPESNAMFPHQHLFSIDEFAGNLKVAGILNREQQETIQVLVVARDNPTSGLSNEPQLSDHVLINITLRDVNDNTPDITSPTGTYQVTEDHSTNIPVFQVEANDPDTRIYSTLTYSFAQNDSPFQINPNTGIVTLTLSLDYDYQVRSYNLLIRVSDGDNVGEEPLTIIVTDTNDERPRFTPLPQYTALVNESEAENHPVERVSAFDIDTPSSQLTFTIENGNGAGHFRIDPQSGQIYTNVVLNREEIPRYILTISVHDGAGFALQEALVNITVIDTNDNVPYFVGAPYSFPINENLPIGSTVDTIEAADPDLGTNGEVRYSITATHPIGASGWFDLNMVTGELTTNEILNRESSTITPITNSQVTLQVGARDLNSPTLNTTTVTITIVDQNDQRPRFTVPRIVQSLTENYPIGLTFLTVQAIDDDLPPFNSTRYSIDGFPPGATLQFHIDSTTGALSLLSTLDYEQQEQHNITIIARDENQEDWFATQMITIDVLNARELNLKCDDFFPLANVTENSPVGHTVVLFECTDLDGVSVDQVEYNLTNLDGSPSTYFGIREDIVNGKRPATVYTLRNIDRDTLPKQVNGVVQITVVVTARDPNTSENSFGSINSTLTIRILDINDNPPHFLQNFYDFSIPENNELGAFVGFVAANDLDNGANGTVSYSIQTAAVPFTIDENSGEISASQSLDRETNSFFDFVVVARDGGNPAKQDNVNVRVNVIDQNDNPPEFDANQNRTIIVGEETSIGSIVGILLVTDADSDAFGPITIEIAPGSRLDIHFELYSNGSLVLRQELDREQEEFYSFTAMAQDRGGRDRTATFNIVVEDYNDNPPVFNPNQLSQVAIREDHPVLTHVITVSATDQDTGRNGAIRYVLADKSLERTFCISTLTGQIDLCDRRLSCQNDEIIDFERQPRYDVTVIAYDMGFPRHIVNKTVTIFIDNVNEHPPMFDKSEVMVYAIEGEANTKVANLRAYDWDYDDLTYEVLQDGQLSSEFRYDDGAILTNRRLDYSATPLYMLTLRALETAGTKNGSIEVEVFVNNTNDHRPAFDFIRYETSALIPESTSINTVVLTVHADDADNHTHDAVSYSIVSGNVNGRFGIDPLFGDIYVNNSLDFDTINMYLLTIQATDTGIPAYNTTGQVSIRLINENDETPIFNAMGYSFNITENRPSGTVVGNVLATDHDDGTSGIVRYSFLQDNAYFAINEMTGEISSRVDIDREAYESESNNMNPVSFTVVATDQGLTDSRSAAVSVQVTILDENDNPPTFSQGLFIISIPPNQPVNTTIDTIAATDLDSGENAIPRYEITTMPSGISLDISSSTGELFLLQPLPANYQTHYDLVVTATDSQNTLLSSETRVRLVVETDSDHHPRFDDPEGTYSVVFIENTPSGRSVFDVSEHVSDMDSGPSSQITYTFAEEYSKFSINPSTGVITLAQTLDFETESEYSLIIHASDNTPGGARTATATLSVSVTGFNDFSPVFVNLPRQVTLSPVPFVEVELFTLLAMDNDDGVDGEVEYSIVDVRRLFTVDSNTGVVRNQGILEDGNTYTIEVSAFDRGSPILSSSATVMVNIVDPTTNAPSFAGVSDSVTYSVNEDLEVGTSFAPTLVTTPPAQTYQIVRHNGTDGMFIISQTQGQFTLQNKLNHRFESQYQLIVEARIENRDNLNNNVVRYSSFIEVDLVVNDMNDNPPRYLVNTPRQTISEDTAVDVTLFTVTATDEDSGVNGQINYEIINGNFDRAFKINASTGAVSLMSSLNWEQRSSYELTIRAFDSSNQPKTAQTIVPISVTDVNDYVPRFLGNYTIGVYEYPHTQMGDKIIKLAATDKDEGPPLRYTLDLLEVKFKGQIRSASQDMFVIDTDTGAVSVGQQMNIDREQIDYYHFLVTVTDQAHTVTTYLTINVLDVNDHTPVLSGDDRTIEIREDVPQGTKVTSDLSYTDRDDGINSWAQYSLGEDWPAGDHFVIDPNTGVIRINNPIVNNPALNNNDHEFEGTVILTDQGVSPRSTSVTLTVLVIDVNNNAPVFEQDSHVIPISVNTPPGQVFYRFNASDVDFIQNGAFTIRIPTYYDAAHNSFQVDTEGDLSVKNHGQALEIGNYSFRVEAFTQSFHPNCAQYLTASYANVNIVVLPENTGCPPFARESYTFSITEEEGRQEPLDTLSTADPDGDNVRYSISLDSNEILPFEINEVSGAFSLMSPLDRETRDYYEFMVFATDDGFPSRTCSSTITIIVQDINDNEPVFSNAQYEGSIVENSMPSDPILTVNATDYDSGTSGEVQFSLVVDDIPFRIDGQSGGIFAIRSLNCEAANSYNFPVVASDSGNPPMESTATVTILVTGVDEFQPTFDEESYEFYVTEDQVSGNTIGTVHATDRDMCNQRVLTYSFENREPLEYFRIDNTTGAIILIKDPISAATTSPPQNTVAKRQVNSQNYFTLTGRVKATSGRMSATVDVLLNIHNVFITDGSTQEPIEFEIIAIVVTAVFTAIFVFVIILIVTLVCRKKKHSGTGKINDSEMNNGLELNSRFSSRRSQGVYTPQYKQTSLNHMAPEHTTLNHSSGSGSNSNRDSYTADDEMDSINGEHNGIAYGSPGLNGKTPTKVTPHAHARSTSDLASSVATDALAGASSQDTSSPYDKAQIAAIYAANMGLLANSSSHDSIHMFGSEGGGEDGDVDIGNMLFAKYNDLEDDDEDDDSTTLPDEEESYQPKMHRPLGTSAGNVNVPPVEEDPFAYGSQDTNSWMPHVRPMDATINEIANPNYHLDERMLGREPYAVTYGHSNSQGMSMYEASTQGSRTSLIRHHTGPFSHSQQLRQPPIHVGPMMSQEYGDYREYNPPPIGRHPGSRGKRYGSATALSNGSDYHTRDMHPPRAHMHVGGGFSQEMNPPYHHQYHTRGIRTQTPTSSTPTDGTVTPQRAMVPDYDPNYLSSSSTSLGSTNISSSHDQGSIDHRRYP